jgi:hypothetical protein
MKYLPFLTGTYSTAPGLSPMSKAEGKEQFVFQIDDNYDHYIENKLACLKENIHKNFYEERLSSTTATAVNRYLVQQLLQEYPNQFKLQPSGNQFELINLKTDEHLFWRTDWKEIESEKYVSLLDGLCSQVQEDLAVVQLENENDYLTAIHLCSPNHWAPGDKTGKPFYAVHAPVPEMERTLLHYKKMLLSIVNSSSPMTRFAWGVATDKRLNHHPEPPSGINPIDWWGRQHDNKTTCYVRSERQNLVGFSEVNAFLFTIRTYFYPIKELTRNEKEKLLSAIKSMSPASLRYKGLENSVVLLEEKIREGL